MFRIPMSICNFRCHYCYLSTRENSFENIQPKFQYSPEAVAKALSTERLGGLAFMNFCADGETLLTQNLDQYIHALVSEGHYAEIVTNLTVTPSLEKILSWEPELLKRVEFKCSFHYLELKKLGLLNVFAENVKKIWAAGASANIEITPSDELIPYLEEIKAFSLENFGALPHVTIARDDRTSKIDYLTSLPMEEYDRIWSEFHSDFWTYKRSIFGIKQREFCYAGLWSLYIDLTTGKTAQCYCGRELRNVFEETEKPIWFAPIGRCSLAHCYNGHAFLTLGLIPNATDIKYGDIRDRVRSDGSHWLQPELHDFFNSRCWESNCELTAAEKMCYVLETAGRSILRVPKHAIGKVKNH